MENKREELINDIKKRVEQKILEPSNADLLIKLIKNADNFTEAISIAELGTTYKKTGFHFNKRLEKMSDTIKYFKKDTELSFQTDPDAITHKLIIGDNYEALLNLLIQYKGKIDIIYIDPPYGKDSMGEFADTNYDNAITRDNLLSMLYPRLVLAKLLLSNTGIIFCSIDDKNQAYVKGLFDDIFEEKNFIANFIIDKTAQGANQSETFKIQHEYLLMYKKQEATSINSNLHVQCDEKKYKYEDKIGRYAITNSFDSINSPLISNKNRGYTVYYNKKTKEVITKDEYNKENNTFTDYDKNLITQGYTPIRPGIRKGTQYPWNWEVERFLKSYKEDLVFQENSNGELSIYHKNRFNGKIKDTTIKKFDTRIFGNKVLVDILGYKAFDYPKSVDMLKWILTKHLDKNTIILDFFAGSGTTGQAVLELNKEDGGKRQFILCTLNEKTEITPNGVVYDVTSKRLKRIMTGKCYDDNSDFEWIKNNEPLGDNLDVYDILEVANNEYIEDKTPFDVIDETLYGQKKLSVKDKIQWVINSFEITQKRIGEK